MTNNVTHNTIAANRMRASRERKRRGAMVVLLELEGNEIDALVADGWLATDQRDDRGAVEAAVRAVICAGLGRENASITPDGRVRIVFNLTPASVQILADAGFLEADSQSEPGKVREAFRAAAEAGCSA